MSQIAVLLVLVGMALILTVLVIAHDRLAYTVATLTKRVVALEERERARDDA